MSREPSYSQQSELFESLSSSTARRLVDSSDQIPRFDQAQAAHSFPFGSEAPAAEGEERPPSRPVQAPNVRPRPPPESYLSIRDLCARFHVAKATIWRWAANSSGFPRPVKLSPGTTRWRESDIQTFEKSLEN